MFIAITVFFFVSMFLMIVFKENIENDIKDTLYGVLFLLWITIGAMFIWSVLH